jgi:hypothetical protein
LENEYILHEDRFQERISHGEVHINTLDDLNTYNVYKAFSPKPLLNGVVDRFIFSKKLALHALKL